METVLYRHSEETPDECEVGHRELGQRGTRPILTCSHSRPVINQTRVLIDIVTRHARDVLCAALLCGV